MLSGLTGKLPPLVAGPREQGSQWLRLWGPLCPSSTSSSSCSSSSSSTEASSERTRPLESIGQGKKIDLSWTRPRMRRNTNVSDSDSLLEGELVK